MLPGESSCPNDSEYVCQRGVEGVRPSNGRPKLTVVSKKIANIALSQKNISPTIDMFFVTPHSFTKGSHFVALD